MARRGAADGIGAWRPALLFGSALFHVALLMLLARYLSQIGAYAETPAMEVSLVPPLRPERAERGPGKAALPGRGARPPREEAALPVLSAPPEADAAAAGPPRGETGAAAEAHPALRALRGCDRAGLTREDRELCEARRWARAEAVGARVNLDLSGRYADNPEPFLSRRPSKGCRARVTGDVGPMGDDQHARAGVTCVKPF